MELLSSLTKEEILEVLSHGLCHQCETLVHDRIRRTLHKRKRGETSYHGEEWEDIGDEIYMSMNGNGSNSESLNARVKKEWKSPINSLLKHDSTLDENVGKHSENLYPGGDLKDIGGDLKDNGENLSLNGNASIAKSLNKRIRIVYNPRNSLQKHDSTLTVKDNKHNFDSSIKYLKECKQSDTELLLNDGIADVSSSKNELSEERREHIRYSEVQCKKDFTFVERINGRDINLLQGLELHTGVFNAAEQNEIVECIYRLQMIGQQGRLRDRTYSKPRKGMRGKGLETLQFGCYYNYAVDKYGNPPGICRTEEVDPLPDMFKQMIKRMVRWNIVPPTCVPDSCIVNIYDVGDCIPPHIDHHDFVRPIYCVSFLNEAKILFGSNLKAIQPGEFSGPASISLPVGSVFVLNGNGADIAKHCIPSVSSTSISITFRKMDETKLPYKYSPDSGLMGIESLSDSGLNKPDRNSETQVKKAENVQSKPNPVLKTRHESIHIKDEYPLTFYGNFRKLK